jgi:hypothetical protein
MGTSLIGVGGLQLAISLVVTWLDYMYGGMKKTEGATNDLKDSVTGLISIISKDLKYGIKPEQAPAFIKSLEKKLAEITPKEEDYRRYFEIKAPATMTGGAFIPRSSYIDQEAYNNALKAAAPLINSLKADIEELRIQFQKYQVIQVLSTEYEMRGAKEIEKSTKATKEKTKELKDHNAELLKYLKMRAGKHPISVKPMDISDAGALQKELWEAPKVPAIVNLGDFEKDVSRMKVVISETANFLQSAFSGAWQAIFGEANSLLEQFIANVASRIFALETERMAASIVSTIPGGSLFGWLFSLLFGKRSALETGGTSYIVMDGETIGRAMLTVLPKVMRTAEKMRLI